MATKEQLLVANARDQARCEIIRDVTLKRPQQREAAEALGIGVRQVKRLCRAYRQEGACGVVSQRRGEPSNHHLAPGVGVQAIELIRTRFPGASPTHAGEKLREEGLQLSRETLRRLMLEAGLWQSRQRRTAPLHPARTRRPQ